MPAGLQTWIDPSLSTAPRELEQLRNAILTQAMRPAIAAAGKHLADVEKQSIVHDRTGALRQSIGSRAKLYADAELVWAAAGPRHGFGRIILTQTTKRGKTKLKRTSRQFTAENRGQAGHFANPARYAHFLVSGRKASVAGQGRKKAKSLFDAFTGRFFGRQVAAAPKRNFLAPAEAAISQAAEIYVREVDARLARLTTT